MTHSTTKDLWPIPSPAAKRVAHRRRNGGFSLVELLLVLVILAVLAAVVIPKFTGRSEQARITAAKTDIASIETALDSFEIDTGAYPDSSQGLAALVSDPGDSGDANAWRGPYLKSLPNDPWGNAYLFEHPGANNTNGFDISSAGPDGQHGTEDDITNWSSN